eukprot:Amastigsp_a180953_36.p3 type:complete len:119 gc:universal Amastigsp_a180953_36:809-453(-)
MRSWSCALRGRRDSTAGLRACSAAALRGPFYLHDRPSRPRRDSKPCTGSQCVFGRQARCALRLHLVCRDDRACDRQRTADLALEPDVKNARELCAKVAIEHERHGTDSVELCDPEGEI